MFIEPVLSMSRAPAERNVSSVIPKSGIRFAPLERGQTFGARALYKHYVPTGRGTWIRKIFLKKELGGLFRRSNLRNLRSFLSSSWHGNRQVFLE